MPDRPIIFSAPMIAALLAGRKRMTRRLAWRNPAEIDPQAAPHPTIWQLMQPGDRLWCREALRVCSDGLDYAADGAQCFDLSDKPPSRHSDKAIELWHKRAHIDGPDLHPTSVSPMMMPRWASRLTLTVTAVRVETLQAISEDDARAEGFEDGQLNDGFGSRTIGGGFTIESPGTFASASGMFLVMWSKLHPEWDGYSDVDVVAITFSVERRNIDAPPHPSPNPQAGSLAGSSL